MSIHDIILNPGEIGPMRELVFKFALKRPRKSSLSEPNEFQESEEHQPTFQRLRQLKVGEKVQPGLWRVNLVFAIETSKAHVQNATSQNSVGTSDTPSDNSGKTGLKELWPTISVRLRMHVTPFSGKLGSTSESPVASVESICSTDLYSTTRWQKIGSSSEGELLDVSEGQFVLFELRLSLEKPVNPSSKNKTSFSEEDIGFLFGGIRQVHEYLRTRT
jgi:hypothetical protein